MGLIQRLCEECEWDKAYDSITEIINKVSYAADCGVWSYLGIDPDDVLYAMFILSDDVLEAKENGFYQDLAEFEEECETDVCINISIEEDDNCEGCADCNKDFCCVFDCGDAGDLCC